MRTRTFLAAATLTLGGMIAAPAFAQAGADPYRAFVDWYRGEAADGEAPTPDEMSARVMEMAADVDFSTMGLDELAPWRQLTRFASDLSTRLAERLATLAEADTAEGARAAIMSLEMDGSVARLEQTLEHPKFRAALEAGQMSGFLAAMQGLPKSTVEAAADRIRGLASLVDIEMEPARVGALRGFAEMLMEHRETLGADFYRETRGRIADRMKSAAAQLAADGADASAVERVEKALAYVDGAYMRGELLDHPAPTVSFDWWSGDEAIASLQDLKGEVVVIDFWATWCGPCISSMPDIRKLVAHYEGYPVRVVGVTSLQGRHFPQGAPPIDCEGDAQKEYNLMPEFMESLNMTWPVAFSSQEVFNPDFGVRGIPHVAIVDPKGVVRHRGLHPSGTPLEAKATMIDALLAEAGLPHPAPVGGGASETETAGGE